MDDRDFDNPNMSGQDEYGEPIPDPLEPLKKNFKTIILLLILCAAAFFIYDYFVGSIIDVSFEVKNLENLPVEQAKLKVFDSSKNKVFEDSDASSSGTKLRRGEYSYTVESPQYKSLKGNFSVDKDNASVKLVLEKNTSVEITSVEFPKQVFAGQTVEGKVFLKNSGKQDELVEIAFDTSKTKDFTIEKISVTVPAENSIDQNFTVSFPDDIRILDQKKGDAKTFKISIRLVKGSTEASFNLMPVPSIDLSDVTISSVKAGDTVVKNLSVRNKSQIGIPDLTIEVKIVNATANNPVDVEKWISFGSEENTKATLSLNPSESQTIFIKLMVPLSAKKETILGKVVLSSTTMPKNIEKNFILTISSESTAKITATLSPSEMTIPFNAELSKYDSVVNRVSVTVRNTGSIALENIMVNVENSFPGECDEKWFNFVETDSFDLQPGDSKKIDITLSAPSIARQDLKGRTCTLQYRYDYTLDPENPVTSDWITISPQLKINPELD